MNAFNSSVFSSTKGSQYADTQYSRTNCVINQGTKVTAHTAATLSSSSATKPTVLGSQYYQTTDSVTNFVVNLDGSTEALRLTPTTTKVPALVVSDWKIYVKDSGDLFIDKKDSTGTYTTKFILEG